MNTVIPVTSTLFSLEAKQDRIDKAKRLILSRAKHLRSLGLRNTLVGALRGGRDYYKRSPQFLPVDLSVQYMDTALAELEKYVDGLVDNGTYEGWLEKNSEAFRALTNDPDRMRAERYGAVAWLAHMYSQLWEPVGK